MRLLMVIIIMTVGLMVGRWGELSVGAVTDDALYVELARSLAEGRGHTLSIGPGLDDVDMDLFPPGMALMLAPWAALFPASLSALKMVPLLSGLALLVLTFLWTRRSGTGGQAMMAVALVAWNPWFVGWSTRVLSDIPFSALSLAALGTAVRALDDRPVTWRWALLTGLLAGAAVAVRSVGWALILALVVVSLWERRRSITVVILAGVMAVLVPMWLLTVARPLPHGYLEQLSTTDGSSMPMLIRENFLGYLQEWPALMIPVLGPALKARAEAFGMAGLYGLVAMGLGLAFLVTLVIVSRRFGVSPENGASVRRLQLRLALIYGLITMGILLNFRGYPSGVQTRLLLPLLPLAVWIIVSVVWSHRRFRTLVLGLMIGSALLQNTWRIAHPLGQTIQADGSGLVDFTAGSLWVRSHVPDDAVIMTPDTIQRHIHWRRPVAEFPQSVAVLDSVIKVGDVAVVLVAPHLGGPARRLDVKGERFLAELRDHPDRYKLTYEDGAQALYLFRVQP